MSAWTPYTRNPKAPECFACINLRRFGMLPKLYSTKLIRDETKQTWYCRRKDRRWHTQLFSDRFPAYEDLMRWLHAHEGVMISDKLLAQPREEPDS